MMSNHTKTGLNPINITNYMINLHIFIKKIYLLNVLFSCLLDYTSN